MDVSSNHPDYTDSSLGFWRKALLCPGSGRKLDLALSLAVMPGTGRCQEITHRVFESHNVGTFILVGIARGLGQRVHRGDVIWPYSVIDVEAGRYKRKGKIVYTPNPRELDEDILRELELYNSGVHQWHTDLQDALLRMQKGGLLGKPVEAAPQFRPVDHKGVLLTGEKFDEAGVMDQLGEKFHADAVGYDMEASGFATACKTRVRWFIVRGVADFGQGKRPGKWKYVAALSAATFTVNFLTRHFSL